MQIKLIQTEIEEAIRNYIQDQVTVKEGMDINIDLSATRGPEGFIANVEIVRSAGATATKTETVKPAEPAQPPRQPATIRKATPIAKPSAVEAAQEAGQERAGVAEDAIPEGEPKEEGSIADEAQSAPTTGRSLFGNVDPVSNS
jgi:hypothetical protein